MRCELITAARQRSDDVSAMFAKSFSDEEDVLGEVGLFDDRVWPNGFEEFVFADGAARVFGEVDEEIEGLAGERDGLGGVQQLAPGAVERELAEL